MPKTIYQNDYGFNISIAAKNEDGTPISLTGMAVTIALFAVGSNTQKWSHAATGTDDAAAGLAHYTTVATDFDTVGDFYALITVASTPGATYSKVVVGDFYTVVEKQPNLVTPADLLKWMQIPSENSKGDETLNPYLTEAAAKVSIDFPSIASSTSANYIILKQSLIKMQAGVLYFMNAAEGNINPDLREQKIKAWRDAYAMAKNEMNNSLTSGSSGPRRVYNSAYSDPNNRLYDPDVAATTEVSTMTGQLVTYTGTNLSGTDGSLNRILTITTSEQITASKTLIFRNGALVDPGDYTIGNPGGQVVIQFTDVNIFNADNLTVVYFA